MADAKVIQDEHGFFDFVIEDGDIASDEGFSSAIYISLFTDARANKDQVKVSESRRGWIGDTASPVSGRPTGSWLWLIEQRRLTQNTLNSTIDYARQALQWMVDDNISTAIAVSGRIESGKGITLQIDITTLEGDVVTQYVDMWRNT